MFYPRHVKKDDELGYFSRVLYGCEINSTFHGIPRENTFKNWSTSSRAGFQFAMKIPKEMTHVKRLDDVEGTWDFFIARVIHIVFLLSYICDSNVVPDTLYITQMFTTKPS